VHVLFLALGGSRKVAAAGESAQVIADGGRATVLIDTRKPWQATTFDPAVEVIALSEVEASRASVRLARLAFAVPRRVLAGRVARLETRVQRRLASRPGWGAGAHQVLRRAVPSAYDVVVVGDPVSMPYAAGLIADHEARGVAVPRITFGLDYLEEAADAR
jgi:hypothetical protein